MARVKLGGVSIISREMLGIQIFFFSIITFVLRNRLSTLITTCKLNKLYTISAKCVLVEFRLKFNLVYEFLLQLLN